MADDDEQILIVPGPGWCRVTAGRASLARVSVSLKGERGDKTTYKKLAGQLREEFKDKEMTEDDLRAIKKDKRADDGNLIGDKGPIAKMMKTFGELKPLTEDATKFAEAVPPVRRSGARSHRTPPPTDRVHARGASARTARRCYASHPAAARRRREQWNASSCERRLAHALPFACERCQESSGATVSGDCPRSIAGVAALGAGCPPPRRP